MSFTIVSIRKVANKILQAFSNNIIWQLFSLLSRSSLEPAMARHVSKNRCEDFYDRFPTISLQTYKALTYDTGIETFVICWQNVRKWLANLRYDTFYHTQNWNHPPVGGSKVLVGELSTPNPTYPHACNARGWLIAWVTWSLAAKLTCHTTDWQFFYISDTLIDIMILHFATRWSRSLQ